MKNVLNWLFRPRFYPGDDVAAGWRLRVWAGLAALFISFLITSKVGPFVIISILAAIYWMYALVRMMNARIRNVHIPSRDELRDRYMDDPDSEL